MPFNLGMTELLVVLLVVLLVFGAKRLPEIGSSMGKGIREFKKSIKDVQQGLDEEPPPGRRIDAPTDSHTSGDPKKLSE
ncbi:MAG: twin-arginine translocase TatA/TatE family subunit [Gemmatimonadota bacterium]|jgi:sec-independent protein translocase protein TatA|nr:twin-arginine translocase TatA/TatE family subunit [Gemmatimonadota bacterium]MDH3368129.1 twin-arginine translocase TatA/TatE family subunit [Gemmatimonadota bacterium]MDH3479733.1 twin-arginine translocase TatA/TatE family subunit [Gemmatimonadota bacterium]MDH3569253.1 twin-arginine translocase TatA/TatE family subunit [Gemmatimonadota bacterium]MDH5549472.1 twin-arginine translocase TatA/TatE family subunit [Gemmatimonadota bacterium]